MNCQACGRLGSDKIVGHNGFFVHSGCMHKVERLDLAHFHSATVITHLDRATHDMWIVITDYGTDARYNAIVYNSTQEYLDHDVARSQKHCFYTSAIVWAVEQFGL